MEKLLKLKEVCEIKGGYAFKSTQYKSKGIPLIRIGDISDKVVEISDESVYIDDDVNKYDKFIIKKGDILIALSGATTGKFGIYNYDELALLNQRVAKIKPNELVEKKYIFYYLNKLKNNIYSKALGCAQPNISPTEIGDLDIYLPSLEQQQQIVSVLDKISLLIDKRKKQLKKLDELVKSRFVEMFGDPVENDKGLSVKTLKQLSTVITNGNTPKGGSENYVDEGILFLRSQNVWRNRIELDDVAYIDETTHRSMRKSSLKHKDILITKTGRINTENSSLGRAALYLGKDDLANINGHVYLVRLDGSVIPEYVISILTSEAYRKYIRKVCVGGIDKRQINLDQVENFPIILPPLALQREFAAFVEKVDQLEFKAKASLEKLETLKKAMMQKYFN